MIHTGIVIGERSVYMEIYEDNSIHLCYKNGHHIVPYNLVQVFSNGIERYHSIGPIVDTRGSMLIVDGVDLI